MEAITRENLVLGVIKCSSRELLLFKIITQIQIVNIFVLVPELYISLNKEIWPSRQMKVSY
tara:strand:+ start:232 stop:414 length:183 start_codon:yes stop_codon:yes gene_type:complete